MKLRNKNVLIFGGGSGIGKSIAVRFIEAGAKVMITGRTEEKLKAVAEEIGSPDLYYNIFDITDIENHAELFSEYEQAIIKWTRAFGKKYGHDGIIINGIAPGSTFTPMISHYAKQIDQPYPRHAIERFIRPDEIAELAFYLMSDYGEIVCGHTVVAEGGYNCATH